MNIGISISTPNRIAAGVTAAYLRDLSRRPASSPGDGRRGTIRSHRVAAAGLGRDATTAAGGAPAGRRPSSGPSPSSSSRPVGTSSCRAERDDDAAVVSTARRNG